MTVVFVFLQITTQWGYSIWYGRRLSCYRLCTINGTSTLRTGGVSLRYVQVLVLVLEREREREKEYKYTKELYSVQYVVVVVQKFGTCRPFLLRLLELLCACTIFDDR